MPTTEDPSSSASTRRPLIEVDAANRNVRVTLSLPDEAKRPADRRKVLERARRMLAAALEEDERKRNAVEPRRSLGSRPGCGAWWQF
jgi:hypothetical protein